MNTSNLKMKKPCFKIFYLFIIIGLIACNEQQPPKKPVQNQIEDLEKEKIFVPEFNADTAYRFIENQVNFGPRVPNTKGHAKCAEYLINELKSSGWEVQVQNGLVYTFNKVEIDLKNIIASYQPDLENRILLMAHWDTRPFADQDSKDKNKPILGANDGASGVGVLLEIARIIGENPVKNIGVDIILFDAEDYGKPSSTMSQNDESDTYCLGSQYWAKNPHKENYNAKYGILLDMVGAKNASFSKEGGSMYYAPNIVEKVWSAAKSLGYDNYFLDIESPPITDDHYYVNKIIKIPSIDIIHYETKNKVGFGDFWHTHNDNMEVIDKSTLEAVGQTLLEIIYNEK
jgi:Zn-dependent M28 family amino/carboxypeptidase